MWCLASTHSRTASCCFCVGPLWPHHKEEQGGSCFVCWFPYELTPHASACSVVCWTQFILAHESTSFPAPLSTLSWWYLISHGGSTYTTGISETTNQLLSISPSLLLPRTSCGWVDKVWFQASSLCFMRKLFCNHLSSLFQKHPKILKILCTYAHIHMHTHAWFYQNCSLPFHLD